MSLATACPSCNTVFRVVQDQLKVSEGWVRCGNCHKVFNAIEHLFDLDSRRAVSTPRQTPQQIDMNDPAWQETAPAAFSNESLLMQQAEARRRAAARPQASPDTGTPADSAATSVAAPTPPVPAAPEATSAPPQTAAQPDAGNTARTSVESRDTADLDDEFPITAVIDADHPEEALLRQLPDDKRTADIAASASAASPAAAAQVGMPQVLARAEQPTGESPQGPETLPGFVREADRRARWQRPWVRVIMALLCLVLLAALGGQLVYQQRDRLAARWPQLQPLLERACEHLQCRLQPPRLIDAIVVDNTALTRPPGVEGYRLSVVLHNRASHVVAAPHLELSLSDTNGTVVIRRVLAPIDLEGGQPELPAQSEQTWALAFQTPGQNIAGYTVSAFYP